MAKYQNIRPVFDGTFPAIPFSQNKIQMCAYDPDDLHWHVSTFQKI
ncbi:hypothetical protein [Azospirillum melinis]